MTYQGTAWRHVIGIASGFLARKIDWPYSATAWTEVHVRRLDLARWAKRSKWTPFLRAAANLEPHISAGASPDAATSRHRRSDPENEERLRDVHTQLGRVARDLREEELAVSAWARKIAKDRRNFREYSAETIKKMLLGNYGPFVRLGLPPLGSNRG